MNLSVLLEIKCILVLKLSCQLTEMQLLKLVEQVATIKLTVLSLTVRLRVRIVPFYDAVVFDLIVTMVVQLRLPRSRLTLLILQSLTVGLIESSELI